MRQISKSLDSIIAQATFRATKQGATHGFENILFLELISHHESLSYQLLSARLEPQQIDHVESQIRRISETTHSDSDISLLGITPAVYYSDLTQSLIERYKNSSRLTTLHALHFIISDESNETSKMLKMYGITASMFDSEIEQYGTTTGFIPLLSIGLRREPKLPSTPKPQNNITNEQQNARKRSASPHPLSKFGEDLTQLAKDGAIDPVIGREQETERVVEILSRRKKNNPVLVGEAGVGKSAIVEGLALRMAAGDVPHTIRNKRLFSIDISALVAGTKFRGDFEQRMQELLTTLKASHDTIIFIDEIHTIVGAGSTQGSLDTANILKPALARGEIQTIGATTFDEYRNNIESDAALERRLQRVVVEPTTEKQSIDILLSIAPNYEEHHRVIYTQEAIEACVKLSHRYITDRHLPDKAIDLMDEAGARKSIQQDESKSSKPKVIHRADIESIITATTGIDVEALTKDERRRLQSLEEELNGRVIGQSHAVSKLSRTIRRSRSGLASSDRPIGVFMFVGQTGVGKTHLAKELSKWMFGTKRSLIRLDMSEYSESHNASRLIGSPPGYVGYGEGGELSEAVRRNPYSVVLLDEIEKAHPDIFNVMLQIFDEGHLTDGAGRKIDFRNTIIIMTSNVGSRNAAERPLSMGYATTSKQVADKAAPAKSYREAMERTFAPEFINRIDEILMFGSLSTSDLEKIVTLELERIFERVRSMGYDVRITPAARRELASLGYESKYGARALRRTLLERVEEPLSDILIDGSIKSGQSIIIERVRGGSGVKLRIA